MPTISTFYGILIRMFFNDHAPPHFRARDGKVEATIDIDTLAIIEGQLPRRSLNLYRELPEAGVSGEWFYVLGRS
jgi:hypothetical protein